MNCYEVRTSGMSKPTYTSYQIVICLFSTLESRRVVILRRRSNGVNRNTGPVRSRRRSLVAVGERENLDQIRRKTGLSEVDGYLRSRNLPREMHTKEPVDNSHEVNLTPLSKRDL